MTNFAIEFASLKDRISGTIEYYTKKSTDLISYIPADLTSGFSSFAVNSAILTGKGWDITLNSKNIVGKSFQWQTTLIFSYNSNTLKKYLNQKNEQLRNSYK